MRIFLMSVNNDKPPSGNRGTKSATIKTLKKVTDNSQTHPHTARNSIRKNTFKKRIDRRKLRSLKKNATT